MPSLLRDGLRGRPAVAGQHHDADALGVQRADRLGRAVLDRIRDADQPAELAVDRDEHDGLAVAAQRPRRARRARRARRRASSISARLPSATSRRRPCPRTPLPVIDSKPVASRERDAALLGALDDRRRERMLAAALEARGEPRAASARRSPAPATTPTSFGLPSVSVPVLSTTSVSTLRRTSIASALRNSTPIVAPLPVATMIDIGVARPSAHGHAMISTATALMSACAMRGSGPTSAQTTNVHDRDQR